jgi:17beta-estradiol 17-dehydrogenase / very-long-chain 3-oxoacyl-CoA reductase
VDKFSQDLSSEYQSRGIVVQCILPGYVATKMSRIRKATFMAPSPAKYVSHALSSIGLEDSTTGYWPHKWLVSIIS